MAGETVALIQRGRRALDGCDWATARSSFEQALALEESAEIVDGLGQALYWQGDYARALPLRERAYALYRQRGDRPSAAIVAVQLAQLHGLVYGNGTAVSGWVGHARRMLEDCEECAAHGLLELFLGVIAHGPDERERRARAAVRIGRRFDAVGLEYDALGYVGKARIEVGAVGEGMRLIDEAVAAVAGGLVTDAWSAGSIYCSLFHACEMAIDVTRAEQWLASVDHYVDRTDELPISAICRMHYGGLLTCAGRWVDAERELQTALSIYGDTYRGTRFEPLLRLAELRARQGRVQEAERLLDGYEDHPQAALPRARVLLARDEAQHARTVLNRHLHIEAPTLAAAPGLAFAVDCALACDAVDEAHERTTALERLAAACDVPAVHGLAKHSRGRVEARTGGDAIGQLEAALVAFADAGMAHDLARARLELAEQLAGERPAVARGEARGALEGFRRIGAVGEADAAAELLRGLEAADPSGPRPHGALTARQREVLELVAEGLTNAQIGERLFISPRTVEHHVSAVLAALHLKSRTEAAAYVVRASGAP